MIYTRSLTRRRGVRLGPNLRAPAGDRVRWVRCAAFLACLAWIPSLAAQAVVPADQATDPHVQTAEMALAEALARFGGADDPWPAHAAAEEHCLLPLMSRIREAAPFYSAAEQSLLVAASPELALALQTGLRRHAAQESLESGVPVSAAAAADGSALPDHPELDMLLEGKECIVHYTLSGEHSVPDVAYVKLIQKSVDQAAKKLTKIYKRPYYEPAEDGIDKLHVFVLKLNADPDIGDALGVVGHPDDVPGEIKAQTVYMAIDATIRQGAEQSGKNWKRVIKATCFHEYMHCIQAAYNAFFGRWAVEGQAVFAEGNYSGVADDMIDFLKTDVSIFNMPELPLWHDSLHQYSTAPLFFYLEFRLGKGGNLQFLENSPLTNDAVEILGNTLFLADFLFFDDFFPAYWARLYQKSIKGIPKKLMPDLAVMDATNSFGWSSDGSVPVTGLRVYELNSPNDKAHPTDLLFTKISQPGDGGGTPTAVLVHSKNKRLTLFNNFWDNIGKFRGKKAQAALLVSDIDYDFPTATETDYRVEAFAPSLVIQDVEVTSPVQVANPATITFTYDLVGTPVGAKTFGVVFVPKIKGPGINTTKFLFRTIPVGTGQMHEETYTPADKGTHKLNYTVKTPTDQFGGEHVKDRVNVKVVAQEP